MKLKLKDPWSAITHGVAGLLAIAGAAPLLLKAASGEEAPLHIAALAVFMLTMILLYTASTVYHSVDSTEKVNRRLRKMDHMMIFVMIISLNSFCLISRKSNLYLLRTCMGSCNPWHAAQGTLDHLPEMAVLRSLYRNGLALCTGFCSDLSLPPESRFRMAACGRHYLHDRRYHLWSETSII